jgi:hypothetical protein
VTKTPFKQASNKTEGETKSWVLMSKRDRSSVRELGPGGVKDDDERKKVCGR